MVCTPIDNLLLHYDEKQTVEAVCANRSPGRKARSRETFGTVPAHDMQTRRMRSRSLKKPLRSDEGEAWSKYCMRTGIRGQWGVRRATWEGVEAIREAAVAMAEEGKAAAAGAMEVVDWCKNPHKSDVRCADDSNATDVACESCRNKS
jgi:hypothetical protein